MLDELRAYFREMNVAERLADEMLKTSPREMRYLNPSEQAGSGWLSLTLLKANFLCFRMQRCWVSIVPNTTADRI